MAKDSLKFSYSCSFLKDATRSSEVVEEENNWYRFMFVGNNIDMKYFSAVKTEANLYIIFIDMPFVIV